MGLLASVFGDGVFGSGVFGNGNTVKNRKKNRHFRVCRIEEMEPRVMLSANPLVVPDPVDFGIVFHDAHLIYEDCPYEYGNSYEQTKTDIFYIAWDGGVAGTQLNELVITFGGLNSQSLFFGGDIVFLDAHLQTQYENYLAGDLNGVAAHIDSTGQILHINFNGHFTDKTSAFTVEVYHKAPDESEAHIVDGVLLNGTKVEATFVDNNDKYHDLTFAETFRNNYTVSNSLEWDAASPDKPWIPQAGAYLGDYLENPGQSHASAGATTSDCLSDDPDKHTQTPKVGTISGHVWHDRNADDIWQPGGKEGSPEEKGINGVRVELWVLNANGEYEQAYKWDWDGEKYVNTGELQVDYTKEGGAYSFSKVKAGETYQIRIAPAHEEGEIADAGYIKGGKVLGKVDGTENGELGKYTIRDIVMPAAGVGTEYNFALYIPPSLSGKVIDKSHDEGIPGAVVVVYDENGEEVGRAITDEYGNYTVAGLSPGGTYTVEVQLPEKYCYAGGAVGTVNGDDRGEYAGGKIIDIVVFSADAGEEYNFFADLKGKISGYVYVDEDGSGGRSILEETGEWEPGIGGVTLSLWILKDGTYMQFLRDGEHYTVTTDENGYYAFKGLCPNQQYKVRVEGSPAEEYEDVWLVTVGKINGADIGHANGQGEIEQDHICCILLPPGGKGQHYNFGVTPTEGDPPVGPPVDPPPPPPPPPELPDPPPPPPPQPPELPEPPPQPPQQPQSPNPPFSPPSSFTPARPVGGAGAFASPGVGGWYAPSIGEQMRAGFGSGPMMSAAAAPAFSWNLSVINAGYPRANGATDGIAVGEHASRTTMILSEGETNPASGARYVSVAWNPLPMNQSGWYVRGKDGLIRKRFTFGPDGGVPVVGDFSGDGIAKLAVYHEGHWYIDLNGNGRWDEEDLWVEMGSAADQPVAGDWDGDGKTDIGTFGPMRSGDAHIMAAKSGLPTDLNTTLPSKPKNVPPDISINVMTENVRAMKHSQEGGIRLDVVDHVFQYGNEGDKAFTGDFTGDGIATIGIYRDGKWYIDLSGTGNWDEHAVLVNNADFGLGPDGIPVIGDFNGDGIDKIGLYVNGVWHLDTTGDFRFDTRIEFGEAGDYPVVGDFDGSGIAQLAVYRASTSENPLMASIAPEPAMGTGAGMVARDFSAEPASQEDQESLKHQGRTISTPHTNAPLLRGQ